MVRQTQEQRKADTRARLIEAAAALFADHGVDAVSVDAVAEAAARTSGAVYAQFGSKQGLLLAVLDEWKHSLLAVIAAEFERSADVLDRLRAVASTVIVDPSPQTRQMLLLERELWLRAARDDEVATALQRRSAEAQDHMARGFAAWAEAGLVPTGSDPALLATVFRATVVGLEMAQRVDAALDVESATSVLAAVLGLAPHRPAALAAGRL